MGSFFFFFFFTPLFSVLCLGPGAERMSWPPGRGLGCWFSLLLRGPGGLPVPAPERRGSAPGSGADYPLGVVVPGSRSIECIWGVWVWVLCPFLCVYLWDEGVNIRLRAWGWERMLVYMCACSSSSMCQVGPQTPPHSSSQSTPTPPTCPASGGCRRCVGGFSRRGRMLEWAPAHSLALLALLGPDWGVGGLWVSGPRARSALVWSAAGGACGLAATAPWGVYTVAVGGPTFGLSSALFWVEAAVVPAVVLLGVPCPGGPPDVWGPGLFHACFMPCGMGLLFPTHTIKHLHGGTLWTQARSHTQVYTQAFTLV